MAFRANDSSDSGTKRALEYLVGREFPRDLRDQAAADFQDLVDQYGPVVDSYPCWHPLVACCNENRAPWTHPSENKSYRGLDHFILLRDAFLTFPYSGEENVIRSVEKMSNKQHRIRAEQLDVKLYHPEAKPIVISCEWLGNLNPDGTIPKKMAIPLLLEFELPRWRNTGVAAETWQTMLPYIIGKPNGVLSSLFVNKETGAALKQLWNSLIFSGMFGPIHV